MSNHNLNELSLNELKQLQKDVKKAIDSYEDRQKAEARAKIEAIAHEMGYSLSQLSPMKAGAKPPKYCHPKDAQLTWSGRGRKPRWFYDAIDEGYTPDDMLITKNG